MKRLSLVVLFLATFLATSVSSVAGDECCCCGPRAPVSADEPLIAFGCYTGNATDDRLIPTGIDDADSGVVLVLKKSTTETAAGIWKTPEMPAGVSCATTNSDLDPGTGGTQACGLNNIQQIRNDGFEIGTFTANVNDNADSYCWYQWSKSADCHGTGTYTGDGTSSQVVDVTGDPSFVWVDNLGTASFANHIYARTNDMAANVSMTLSGAGQTPPTTYITDMGTKTFTVGTNFNQMGVVYYYAWWAECAGYMETHTWTGDGTGGGAVCATVADEQVITTTAAPSIVIGWGDSSGLPDQCGASTHFNGGQVRGSQIGPSATGPGNTTNEFFVTVFNGSISREAVALGELVASSFTVAGGPTNQESLNDDTYTYYGVSWYGSTQPIGTVGAEDWSPAMQAVWHCGEATGADRLNNDCTAVPANGGTFNCPAPDCDCNLTDVNTSVALDTVNTIIGGASCAVSAGTQILSQDLTTADELNLTSDFSWGCFHRPTGAVTDVLLLSGTTTQSFSLERNNTSSRSRCEVVTTAPTTVAAEVNNGATTNAWHSTICTFNDTTNTLTNNTDNSTNTGAPGDVRSAAGDFRIGGTTWAGQFVDCFVYDGILAAADICRIHSCGVTGQLCQCFAGDPTVYTDKGRNADVGNCALPACNKTAPS